MSEKTSNDRAPMCRVCEHRHWGREPHVWTKKPVKTTDKKGRRR